MAIIDTSLLPTTAGEAIESGATYYFTGEPCARGHIAPRLAKTGACRECGREKYRAWIGKNKAEKNRKDRSRLYPSHAPERARERWIKWYEANREKKRQADKVWRSANPGYDSVVYARNPEKAAVKDGNRRARKLQAEGAYTASDVKRIRTLQGDRCGYCRAKLMGKGHVDHIVSLARGGSNWPNNIQLLCQHCNLSKGARDPMEFARTVGKLL